MNDEPTHDEVREDDNEPANQGFVRQFVRQEIADLKKVLLEDGAETRRHFDVVAENIHKDVAAANADEISLIKDQKLPDHENRIVDLEEHAGLPPNPRHTL